MDGQLPMWSGSLLDEQNIGASLTATDIVCYVGNEDNYEAELAVDQSDIDYVYPGQTVRILLEPYTDQDLTGTIQAEDDISRRPMEVTPEHLSFQAGGTIATQTGPNGMQRPSECDFPGFCGYTEPGQSARSRNAWQSENCGGSAVAGPTIVPLCYEDLSIRYVELFQRTFVLRGTLLD